MSETPNHFSSPFSFTGTGEANLLVENSAASILAGSYNVCVCPEGFRDDSPEFGIPQLEFQTVPMQLDAFQEAIERWEPLANPQTTERAISLTEQAERELIVEVGGE